jgi:hypothetical protein
LIRNLRRRCEVSKDCCKMDGRLPGANELCIVVNKEVGRVYVDRWVWEEDVFDSRIEVDATDAIHFISSLRL